jgi:hypothetical protein
MRSAYVMIFLLCFFSWNAIAESDTTIVSVNGYVEAYAATQNASIHSRPDFLYDYTKPGFAINLGVLRCSVARGRWNLNASPMTGSYVQRNLATEPNAVQHIYEANLGYLLDKETNMRLEAGIMPSNIGLETNIGKDQITLTRGLLTENTPYYACGLRWSGTLKSGINWAFLVMNGWQRIAPLTKDDAPAFGFQLQYTGNKGQLLNYSTFAGRINGQVSYYQNFYTIFKLGKHVLINAECNMGKVGSNNMFAGASIVGGYRFNEFWSMGARIEQCLDQDGVFFQWPPTAEPMNPGGWSFNTDYNLGKQIKLRGEVRRVWSEGHSSLLNEQYASTLWLYTAACCISF